MPSTFYAGQTDYIEKLNQLDSTIAVDCAAYAAAAASSASSAASAASGGTASATTATTQAGIATTQASNAATSATAASTSATNSATSATNAATSASTATTQASNASTSASNASTSATTATTQAGIATTQAGTATTKATLATTKASEASNSADAAANSAIDAEFYMNEASGWNDAASTSANNAAAYAIQASNYAAALNATSTTSTTVGTGAKTFATQASKQFIAGNLVYIYRTSVPATYMYSRITSYSTTSLVVDVLNTSGSGTFTDWSISVTGIQGIQGPTGATGASGSATAAGSSTQVQYNNTGVIAGSGALTFDTGTGDLVSAVIKNNSSSPALKVTQLGSGDAFVVEDSASTDSTPFVIDSSGSVIIGQSTANYGVGAVPKLAVTTTTETGLNIMGYSSTSAAPTILLQRSKSDTVGTTTVVTAGDSLGTIRFAGAGSSSWYLGASISAEVDATAANGDMPARLVFATTPDGTSTPVERLRINNSGEVGIGGTAGAGQSLSVLKNITGSVNSNGIQISSTIQSDVTTNARGFNTALATQAAAFTLAALTHYNTNQGTIGAGSSVTSQYGYIAGASLTGATANYGFYGAIPSGSGRYNIYMAGTADNYLEGKTGIGGLAAAGTSFRVGGSSTGAAFSNAIQLDPAVQSDASSSWRGVQIRPTVASGTYVQLVHVYANPNTFTGTVTNQMGFYAESSMTGATNNYGFYGNIVAATNRYNLYMAGTADNYLAGNLGIGAVPSGSEILQVTGTSTFNDYALSRARLKDCSAAYYNSGTANAIDYTNGTHQRWTPNTGAQTLSITNWPPTGDHGEMLIEGVNLGAATITWPTITWVKSDGTFTTTFSSNGVTLQSSGIDFIILWTRDAGTTIYGKVIR